MMQDLESLAFKAAATKSALPTTYHAELVMARAGQDLGVSDADLLRVDSWQLAATLEGLIRLWKEKKKAATSGQNRLFYAAMMTYAGRWRARLAQGNKALPDALSPDNIAPWLVYHQPKIDED
jgi:hypothetical protein